MLFGPKIRKCKVRLALSIRRLSLLHVNKISNQHGDPGGMLCVIGLEE